MATWLIPALKLVLPHVGTIVSAVAPSFTRKRVDASTDQMQVLQDQIAELQEAVTRNDAHVKALAKQLQHTVSALEQAAATGERRLWWAYRLSIAALAVSVAAFAVAGFTILGR